MKKKLLIIAFALIFLGGIVFVLTRRPAVDIGSIKLVSESETIVVEGYKVKSVYNDSETEYEVPAMTDILSDMPEISHLNDVFFAHTPDISHNESESEYSSGSGYDFVITGAYTGEVLYSFYDLNLNLISQNEKQLKIPSGTPSEPLSGCIAEVTVNWGKSGNYTQMKYYFICKFE